MKKLGELWKKYFSSFSEEEKSEIIGEIRRVSGITEELLSIFKKLEQVDNLYAIRWVKNRENTI